MPKKNKKLQKLKTLKKLKKLKKLRKFKSIRNKMNKKKCDNSDDSSDSTNSSSSSVNSTSSVSDEECQKVKLCQTESESSGRRGNVDQLIHKIVGGQFSGTSPQGYYHQSTETIPRPGQNSKELNPYWKNNGSGLPEKSKNDKLEIRLPYSSAVGDQSAEWWKKALNRAKEQAQEEGRSLEDIVAERYGSLDNLNRLIDEAENRNLTNKSKTDNNKPCSKVMKTDKKQYLAFENYNSKNSHGWRKKKESVEKQIKTEKMEENISLVEDKTTMLLTDEEMNSLAARIFKAEIVGNTNLANELKIKLDNARKVREELKQENKDNNLVLVTSTNVRGFTQPVREKTDSFNDKKRKSCKTHSGGKLMTYYENDEKYSLSEMFKKEQMKSSADFNAEFLELSTKTTDNDNFDTDIFMEPSTSSRCKVENTMQNAIKKQKKNVKAIDDCLWCLTNNKLQKHLIISAGSKCYLSVPYFHSLTDGHCLIAPLYHATCTTLVDEDIWEEILDYCKKLVRMFKAVNLDVIFFENALNFARYPHMVLHCVPIPYEISNLAPIYFKKAILECEKEWSHNKKLIDINKINVKRAVPKGLPYFMVNFGLDNGFAHVIEEEKYFPKTFAQEIIGGMMDLDYHIWRKQNIDDLETQFKKVNAFKNMWEKAEKAESYAEKN